MEEDDGRLLPLVIKFKDERQQEDEARRRSWTKGEE